MNILVRVFGLISQHDNAGVSGIQFHGSANAVGLSAGHERTAGTTEQIHHYAIGRGAVLDGIRQQWNRLHRRVLFASLGLVEVPDGRLFPVGEPFVLAVG